MFSRRDLLSLIGIIVVLIGIPIAVYLIRTQQIIRSRAALTPIAFTGPNVKTITDASGSSKLIATKQDIELQLTSTLETLATPAPSSTANGTSSPGPSQSPGNSSAPSPAPSGGGPFGDNILPTDMRSATLPVSQNVQRIEAGNYTLSGDVKDSSGNPTQGGVIQVDEYDQNDRYVKTSPVGSISIPSGHYGYVILRALFVDSTFSNVSLTTGGGNTGGPVTDTQRPHGYQVYPEAPSVACTASAGTITGWACDPDAPNTAISVDIHVDGAHAGTVVANTTEYNGPNLQSICGGLNHGFTFNLSDSIINVRDGKTHRIDMFGHNIDSTGREIGGPDEAHRYDYNSRLAALSNGARPENDVITLTCGGSGPTETPVNDNGSIQTSGSGNGVTPREVGSYGREDKSLVANKTFKFNYDGSAHIVAAVIDPSGNWASGPFEKGQNVGVVSGNYLQLLTDSAEGSWSNLRLTQVTFIRSAQ